MTCIPQVWNNTGTTVFLLVLLVLCLFPDHALCLCLDQDQLQSKMLNVILEFNDEYFLHKTITKEGEEIC